MSLNVKYIEPITSHDAIEHPAIIVKDGVVHFNLKGMEDEVFWAIVRELQDAGIEIKQEDLLCG